MSTHPADTWAVGDRYDHYVGRWSRHVAPRFVDALAQPAGAHWVDVGCGTGALSATILDRAQPASVLGIDPSAGFVAHARASVTDPRARFETGDAAALPVADAAADVVASGLVLNFVADPARALAEMTRAVRAGGTVAAYVWDYADGMQLMRRFWDAAVALDAAAAPHDEALRFPLCRPPALRELFERAGLADVRTDAIEIDTVFADFDDYWTPFLGGQGPAPTYAMALAEPARAGLRERLRAMLPLQGDGSIALRARAWTVQGRRR